MTSLQPHEAGAPLRATPDSCNDSVTGDARKRPGSTAG